MAERLVQPAAAERALKDLMRRRAAAGSRQLCHVPSPRGSMPPSSRASASFVLPDSA
jgi:hypothetical protein